MKINGSRKQRGVIVVLVAVVLPVLLFAAGWALDFGHTFVNKTRLQNALDATALSAAIAINSDVTKSIGAASTKGRDTFDLFKNAPGNNELKGLDAGALVFDCSPTLQPWASPCSSTDPFAFVRVKSIDMLNVTPVLVRIFRPEDIKVPAVATAGPVGSNCCIIPFTLCADMTAGPPLYGYTIGQDYDLNHDVQCTGPKNNETCAEFSAGNYGLLNLPGMQGGNDIRLALEAKQCTNTCPLNGNLPLNTQTGNVWGPVSQGIDYRIDTLDTNHNDYSGSTAYADYKAAGGNGMRVMAAPITNCTGMQPGQSGTLPQVGTACVFLNRHPYTAPGGEKVVPSQIVGSCNAGGTINPANPVFNGPYKIVLFKSPGSGDS